MSSSPFRKLSDAAKPVKNSISGGTHTATRLSELVTDRPSGGCRLCSGEKFYRSAMRSSDLWMILQMQFPVRCTRCSQRQFRSFMTACLAEPTRTRVRYRPRKKETWGKWTSGSDKQTKENLLHEQKQQEERR